VGLAAGAAPSAGPKLAGVTGAVTPHPSTTGGGKGSGARNRPREGAGGVLSTPRGAVEEEEGADGAGGAGGAAAAGGSCPRAGKPEGGSASVEASTADHKWRFAAITGRAAGGGGASGSGCARPNTFLGDSARRSFEGEAPAARRPVGSSGWPPRAGAAVALVCLKGALTR